MLSYLIFSFVLIGNISASAAGMIGIAMNSIRHHPSLVVTPQMLRDMDRKVALKYDPSAISMSALDKRAAESAAPSEVLGTLGPSCIYYASISLGTPPTLFNVLLDTGSLALFVAADPCTKGCSLSTTLYTPSLSSTSQSLGGPATAMYGDGSLIEGNFYTDTMTMAGYTLPSQGFAAAHTIIPLLLQTEGNSVLTSYGLSGIMGLGLYDPKYYYGTTALSFTEALYKAGKLPSPEIGFGPTSGWNTISSQIVAINTSQPVNTPGGYVTIGGTNSSLFMGNLTYFDAVNDGWYLKIADLTIDNTSVVASSFGTVNAMIDTGTAGIYFKQSHVDAIYSKIPGAVWDTVSEHYKYPCSAVFTFSIVFGTTAFPITADQFRLSWADYQGEMCYGWVRVAPPLVHTQAIIGNAFLNHYYTSFRYSPASIGLAPISANVSLSKDLPPPSTGKLYSAATTFVPLSVWLLAVTGSVFAFLL